jgi:hypothetical protein
MVGSSGAGSIYLEGFTLQIGNVRIECPYSIQDTSSASLSSATTIPLVSNQSVLNHIGDVLISGRCGNSILFSVKDIAEPLDLMETLREMFYVLSQMLEQLIPAQLKQTKFSIILCVSIIGKFSQPF